MAKKDNLTIIILVIIVIAIILIINYSGGNGNGSEALVQCIADNSQLIVKEGCPACASQEKILEDYMDKFDITDCSIEPQKCMDLGITHVPTWIINEEKYEGVQSIEKLKELTGC